MNVKLSLGRIMKLVETNFGIFKLERKKARVSMQPSAECFVVVENELIQQSQVKEEEGKSKHRVKRESELGVDREGHKVKG